MNDGKIHNEQASQQADNCDLQVIEGDNSVATDLRHFYEDFAEFHDYCALLCDSFISFYVEGRELDINTIAGIKRYANWMKYRSQVLKAELRYIQEKAHQHAQAEKQSPTSPRLKP